jgi:hypothetical protein
MDDLEELAQHLSDIHQSLACISVDGYDPAKVMLLSSQMATLEHSLSDLEDRVEVQRSYLNDIPDLIKEMEQLHSCCQDIPSAGAVETGGLVLPLRRTTPKSTPTPVHERPASGSATARTEKPPKSNAKMTSSQAPPGLFIQHVSDEELKSIAKSVFLRVPIAKVNAWIDEINSVLEKKAVIAPLSANAVKPSQKRQWDRYESERLEDDNRNFFTVEDIKDMPTVKNNQKNALTLLQSLGRIAISTDFQVKRFFVK